MLTNLYSKEDDSETTVPVIWISEPNPLSSPYHILKDGPSTTEDKDKKYRQWLWTQINEGGPAFKLLIQIAKISKNNNVTILYDGYFRAGPAKEIAKAAEWLSHKL